ncbi:hypothetical protein ElyMa_001986200 [Elysia marginata]|uniref:Secreted protein n=1 Tax=Elysia marginata TaxID=1093978 RepID=A0AAV4F2U3_9GAST|nr:hypothetical protein ElyMa_001986200 [Elysia marginata]
MMVGFEKVLFIFLFSCRSERVKAMLLRVVRWWVPNPWCPSSAPDKRSAVSPIRSPLQIPAFRLSGAELVPVVVESHVR